MASLAGTNLGDIQSERQSKNGQLFQFPMPGYDSDWANLYDLFGMMRTININGIITGTDSTHLTFINAIEAIADGAQTGSTFISSKTGFANKTVFIDNFEWNVNKADVSKIEYSLSMIEGVSTI